MVGASGENEWQSKGRSEIRVTKTERLGIVGLCSLSSVVVRVLQRWVLTVEDGFRRKDFVR